MSNIHDIPVLPRTDSTSEFMPVDDKEVEYFFASDASAVIEHTNRVIYLEVSFHMHFIFIKPRQDKKKRTHIKLIVDLKIGRMMM